MSRFSRAKTYSRLKMRRAMRRVSVSTSRGSTGYRTNIKRNPQTTQDVAVQARRLMK